MNYSRRKFLKTRALTAAGAALASNSLFLAFKKQGHIVGVQLYSVRDDMKKIHQAH